jgi:nitrogen fixation protein NifU and related proteins
MSQIPDVPDVPLEGLYGEVILDHYRNPRHRTSVPDADIEAEEFNPFCGDQVSLQLKLDPTGRVAQVASRAQGCSIIQASASMMSEVLAGKTLDELERLAQRFRDQMQGKAPSEQRGELSHMEPLQVVRRYPVRVKCVLLPWTALEEGIQHFRSGKGAN